jgi:hypothetical protein
LKSKSLIPTNVAEPTHEPKPELPAGTTSFCHDQNNPHQNRNFAVGFGSGSGSGYKKSLKYGSDTLVLKGIRENKINLKLCKEPELKLEPKSEP